MLLYELYSQKRRSEKFFQYWSELAIKNDPEFVKKVFENIFKTSQQTNFIYFAILNLEEQNNVEK